MVCLRFAFVFAFGLNCVSLVSFCFPFFFFFSPVLLDLVPVYNHDQTTVSSLEDRNVSGGLLFW